MQREHCVLNTILKKVFNWVSQKTLLRNFLTRFADQEAFLFQKMVPFFCMGTLCSKYSKKKEKKMFLVGL